LLFPASSQVLWAFSIWLEAVAIAPQLIMLQRHKSVENITSYYVASLGAYRCAQTSATRRNVAWGSRLPRPAVVMLAILVVPRWGHWID
jgi:hypothetical protein